MQRYVEQLIEDLQEAKKHVPPEPVFSEEYDEFEEQMLAIETAPDVPVKKLFGISYEELPPADKHTEAQMQQLIDAILETWSEFNISADFPADVPLQLRYELVRETFENDMNYMPGWSMHQDFCSGWCPDCKLVDYCSTKDENWTAEELEEARNRQPVKG